MIFNETKKWKIQEEETKKKMTKWQMIENLSFHFQLIRKDLTTKLKILINYPIAELHLISQCILELKI